MPSIEIMSDECSAITESLASFGFKSILHARDAL